MSQTKNTENSAQSLLPRNKASTPSETKEQSSSNPNTESTSTTHTQSPHHSPDLSSIDTSKTTKSSSSSCSSLPKRFEVQVQARVRAEMGLSSQHLTDLPQGSIVTVEEIIDRRARISRPLCGWLSVTSKYGTKIILPTNKKYKKIGGKVILKTPYRREGKIIDYNEDTSLYQVSFEDGNSQWIDIQHPDVTFISQKKAGKGRKLDTTAPIFTLQTSRQFFNQFFCRDYPQYQAQSSSSISHIDISPVTVHPHNGHIGSYPPPNQPNAHCNRVYQGHPPSGYYLPEQQGLPQPHSNAIYHPPNRADIHYNRLYPRHPPSGHHVPGQLGPSPLNLNTGLYPPHPPQHMNHLDRVRKIPQHNVPKATVPTTARAGGGGNEEFMNDVKEIEKRIIHHLHRKGYNESHPSYYRYLQKAKELAIERADKKRLNISQQKQDKRVSGGKSGGSVKGLIVLRGLPGSGKTTLAKKLAGRSKNARICTEDRYYWSGKEDGVGEYKFQPELVYLARNWCIKEIRECIEKNVGLIILDNCNARMSMYEDHIKYAVQRGYRFRIIEFVTSASFINKYRARSYKKFPGKVYINLLKIWQQDSRAELINPIFGNDILSINDKSNDIDEQIEEKENLNVKKVRNKDN